MTPRLLILLLGTLLGCGATPCPVCPTPHPDPYLARPVSPKGWDDPLYAPPCPEGFSCTTSHCVYWGLTNGATVDEINTHCAEAPGGRL